VLPHVEHEERMDAPDREVLVLLRLEDEQPLRERLEGEDAPARPLDLLRGVAELGLERVALSAPFGSVFDGVMFVQKQQWSRWPDPWNATSRESAFTVP
jgi:hypothetical protein